LLKNIEGLLEKLEESSERKVEKFVEEQEKLLEN